MDTALIIAALVVALILGTITVLALLIAYIVRVCVAKTRSQDMPTVVHGFTGLIGALEKFTPRYQGVQELAAPLRTLQPGQQGDTPAPAAVPQPPVIPGQVVETGTLTAPAGGAQ
ncbi:hypothetical protein [Kitasatospora sp. NPDC056531]|uniref:hypothetical protein n=1 Tax=Kitasatospora sp. NPDC056531 TaxID=3345856 RepID=UPI0036825253